MTCQTKALEYWVDIGPVQHGEAEPANPVSPDPCDHYIMLFTGSIDAVGFEREFSCFLLRSVTPASIFILGNAPIHRKNRIQELAEGAGHKVLFLPKYSPDLNEIEHDCSALKRARMYGKGGTSLDEVIRAYCAA